MSTITQQVSLNLAERAFQLAATIYLISIAGHIKYGIDYYHPALKVIPDDHKPENNLAKIGSIGVWNYANVTFLMAGIMNLQWASTAGPVSAGQQIMFWALVIAGYAGGWKYLRIGYYQPLIPLWYANFFSVVGYCLSRYA